MVVNSTTSSLAERLEQGLYDLNDVYRKHAEYVKAKYRITAQEMEIIQFVILDGKKKMKEIGDYFNIKLSTLTSIIDKIERQKLVKRSNSKEDRRVVYLEASKKGERLYKDYSRYIELASQTVQRSMDPELFETLLTGFQKMAELSQGEQ